MNGSILNTEGTPRRSGGTAMFAEEVSQGRRARKGPGCDPSPGRRAQRAPGRDPSPRCMNTRWRDIGRMLICGALTLALGVAASTDPVETKLLPSDGAAADLFGFSVSVSGDTAIIGAIFDE